MPIILKLAPPEADCFRRDGVWTPAFAGVTTQDTVQNTKLIRGLKEGLTDRLGLGGGGDPENCLKNSLAAVVSRQGFGYSSEAVMTHHHPLIEFL